MCAGGIWPSQETPPETVSAASSSTCSWAIHSSSQEPPSQLYRARRAERTACAQSDTINIDDSAHSTSLAMEHTMVPEGEEKAGPILTTLPY